MPKIESKNVAEQVKWDIGEATDFCADLLEEVNDHNTAAALRALNTGNHELAIDFIKLEKDQTAAGELTPAINRRRQGLLEILKKIEAL